MSLHIPLLDPAHPAEFARKQDGRRLPGKVFSQHKNQHLRQPHPFCFYVTFPDSDLAPVHEVSARKLAAIIGDGDTSRHFTKLELARAFERLDPLLDLAKLIPRLAP